MNITETSDCAAPRHSRRLINALAGSIPRGLFVAALLDRQWSHLATDAFAGIVSSVQLAELGDPVIVRSNQAGDEIEALLLLSQEGITLIDGGHGDVTVEVAGPTRDAVNAALETIRTALTRTARPADNASVWPRHDRSGNVVSSEPVRVVSAPAVSERDNGSASPRRRCGAGNVARNDPEISRAAQSRAYDELRLRISPGTNDGYRVHASTPWAEAGGTFEVPFDEVRLESFRSLASQPIRRGASGLSEAKQFGGALFRALFRDETYGMYREALADATSRRRGLRIKLCLTESPELIGMPWEFLFDAPDFLAMSANTLVVRYLDLPRRSRPLAVAPPLRILGGGQRPGGL